MSKQKSNTADLAEKSKGIQFYDLMPDYNPDEHGYYVEYITEALKNSKLKNIAVTGPYGVGKSSVIEGVLREHGDDAIKISFASFDFTKRSKESAGFESGSDTLNKIQKEIVKQLLYSIHPRKLKGVHFRRKWIRTCREVFPDSFLISFVLTLIVGALIMWSELSSFLLEKSLLLPFLFISFGVIFLLTHFTIMRHGEKVLFSEIKTGVGSISINEEKGTYFDVYLDDLITFFDVSRKTIVIFEDFDRFDEPIIFESIRSLNSNINIRREENPVRFIYAIRDSVFENSDLTTEIVGSENGDLTTGIDSNDPSTHKNGPTDRVKFFDLILPIVPFVTRDTSINHFLNLLKEEQDLLDRRLIGIVSSFTSDMRLIKSIVNEFRVFMSVLTSGDRRDIAFDANKVFAVVAYKNMNLLDFEKVCGDGGELRELSRDFSRVQNGWLALLREKNEALLTDFLDHVFSDETIRDDFYAHVISKHGNRYTWRGHKVQKQTLGEKEFWIDYIYGAKRNNDTKGNDDYKPFDTPAFDEEDLSDIPLNAINSIMNIFDVREAYANNRRLISDVIYSDVSDLANLEPKVQEAVDNKESEFFGKKFTLKSEIGKVLFREGYIGRDTPLYTSVSPRGVMSFKALDYIKSIHELNLTNYDFSLEESDIRELITHYSGILTSPSVFNLDIFNYILANSRTACGDIRIAITRHPEEFNNFFRLYLREGKKREELVQWLSGFYSEVFTEIAALYPTANEEALSLFNAAILNFNPAITYSLSDAVSKFLERGQIDFNLLRDGGDFNTLTNLASVFKKNSTYLRSLEGADDQVAKIFITNDLFVLNQENILYIGDGFPKSLSWFKSKFPTTYKRIVNNLHKFLKEIRNLKYWESVETSQDLVEILSILGSEDFIEKDLVLEDAKFIIQRANPECLLKSLSQVPHQFWEPLVGNKLIVKNTGLIIEYFEKFKLDDTLRAFILNSPIFNKQDFSDKNRLHDFVLAILDDGQMSIQERLKLIEKIAGDITIDPIDVSFESGPLVSELIKAEYLDESEELVRIILQMGWETTKPSLMVIKNLDLVTAEKLDQRGFIKGVLFDSDISPELKERIFNEINTGVDVSEEALIAASEYALMKGYSVDPDLIESVAGLGNNDYSKIVIRMIVESWPNPKASQLSSVLESLGGAYQSLVAKDSKHVLIEATPLHDKLLQILRDYRFVSSYKPEGNRYRVYKTRGQLS